MGLDSVPEETIFGSKLPDILIDNCRQLHAYCFKRLAEFADRPCPNDGSSGAILRYVEVERAAAGLARLGVGKGDVIMILLRNSFEFVLAFLSASRRSATATTANPFCTPTNIQKQVAAASARVIVTEECYVEKVWEFALERGVAVVCFFPIDSSHCSEEA